MSEKEKLRKIILSRRNMLSQSEIREKSSKIREKLFLQPEVIEASTVFCYINFGSEVRTTEIIQKLVEEKKTVAVPVVDKKINEIIPAKFLGFEKLSKGSFGILEPPVESTVELQKIDLVIVPGIAFDKNKNRVGFGKGYFDRFLSKLPPNTPNIALAFDLQIVDQIPASSKDVKVLKIITEKGVI